MCIDERSLGFWALGYGRAAGRPAAVVTSSGTAVANLLPAVVEASLSGVPMLLLTADRPAELRDTAANQTIDQVGRGVESEGEQGVREGEVSKGGVEARGVWYFGWSRGWRRSHRSHGISRAFSLLTYHCAIRQILQAKIFGGFTRWFFDVPPPAPDVPGRTILTTASTAYRYSVASAPPGPVHLNLQVRRSELWGWCVTWIPCLRVHVVGVLLLLPVPVAASPASSCSKAHHCLKHHAAVAFLTGDLCNPSKPVPAIPCNPLITRSFVSRWPPWRCRGSRGPSCRAWRTGRWAAGERSSLGHWREPGAGVGPSEGQLGQNLQSPFFCMCLPPQASRTPYTAHITGNALPAAPGWQPATTPAPGSAPGMAPPSLASPHDGGDGGGPEVAALRSLLAGARRGLVVVGELIDPRDIVAAQQVR